MAVQVYNPKKVKVYIDGKEITGFSPDSKLSIVPGGEGTNKQIGTDGEVVWSIDVDDTFNIELTLLQSSKSNDYLSNMYKNFKENGVTRRIMIKDLMGSTVFSASQCCPQKYAEAEFQKTATSRKWTLFTGPAENINIGGANKNYTNIPFLNNNQIDISKTILY